MKKGELVELDITDVNNLGCGIGHTDSGKTVFVKGAVTNDRIRGLVIKDNKSFAVARLDEIISPSPYRAESDICGTPLSCGGCVYRQIKYEYEKEIKYNFVKSAFVKAGLSNVNILPVTSPERIDGYRNKAQLPVVNTKNGMRAGFYASKTHTVIPISDCAIQDPRFSHVAKLVCRLCDANGITAYDERTGTGLLRHIYLRAAQATGELMLCLVINGDALPRETAVTEALRKECPELVGIILNKNTQSTNVVLGKEYRLLWGKGYIEDILCGLHFRIAPEAFYQVNRDGAELLYGLAASAAELSGNELVADLYCGTGTIGLSMAHKIKKLVGVELVSEAVECAKRNAELNGIKNAEFFCADAGSAATLLKCTGGCRPDVVILDPPRKGSTRELVSCLAALDVPRIVYVSCDPTTLARDCSWFADEGYTIGSVSPVDMFPRTGHVESVVCLSHRNCVK